MVFFILDYLRKLNDKYQFYAQFLKKGNPIDCCNYRKIPLINTTYRAFFSFILITN